jgi:DNA-binding response OmpR family regulator
MSSNGRLVPRQTLINTVWGEDRQIGTTTLDAFINLLRNKVDAPFETKLIHTVKGFGYALHVSEGDDRPA